MRTLLFLLLFVAFPANAAPSLLFNESLLSSVGDATQLQYNGNVVSGGSSPSGSVGFIELDGLTGTRFTMHSTDTPTATGIRAETTWNTAAIGNETWTSWQMMVKQSEWTVNSTSIMVGQMHTADAIVAANPYTFTIQNSQFSFNVPLSDPPTVSGSANVIPIGQLIYGHWYSITVHILFENNDTGFVEAFVDGVPIYRIWSRGTCYNSDAPYWKLGIYDAQHLNAFGSQLSVWFKNLVIYSGSGGTYHAMLGTEPQPWPSQLVLYPR